MANIITKICLISLFPANASIHPTTNPECFRHARHGDPQSTRQTQSLSSWGLWSAGETDRQQDTGKDVNPFQVFIQETRAEEWNSKAEKE